MKSTLRDIRDFLNGLTELQLDQVAELAGDADDGTPGGNLSISALGEDYYYSEEGAFPRSALSDEEFAEMVDADQTHRVYPADTVVFYLEHPAGKDDFILPTTE